MGCTGDWREHAPSTGTAAAEPQIFVVKIWERGPNMADVLFQEETEILKYKRNVPIFKWEQQIPNYASILNLSTTR